MHIITFYVVDYFLELTWICKEGFTMCYLCRFDLGYNGQNPRGLGFDPSSSLHNLKQNFLIIACC
jgi:hypothetical protein